MAPNPIACVAWRHPKPIGASGRCIGQRTDLPLDRRKAKRLAHRIRQAARRHGWPHLIHTSPLQRCAMVGRQLRRWGWRHRIDASLLEMDFGAWDGRPWVDIPRHEVDDWCARFLHGRPGQGESLAEVFARVAAGWAEMALAPHGPSPRLIVAHAGWMQVTRWLASGQPPPEDAAQWPLPPRYGQAWPMGALNSGPSPRPDADKSWPPT